MRKEKKLTKTELTKRIILSDLDKDFTKEMKRYIEVLEEYKYEEE